MNIWAGEGNILTNRVYLGPEFGKSSPWFQKVALKYILKVLSRQICFGSILTRSSYLSHFTGICGFSFAGRLLAGSHPTGCWL